MLFFIAASLVGLAECARDRRPLEERLQSALDRRMRACNAKGASAAVVLPNGTVWQGVSGFSHPPVRMSPDMAFAIGSITKNMVAALTLQLAQEGKLSLDDPIGRWLPPYAHVNGAITIRQMLNHTSGLFMFWENQKLWNDLIAHRTKVFTPEEVLSYLGPPDFRPGMGYHYSNTNYLLAAMIVTRATGSSLSTEMRRRFWQPLGLRSARLAMEEPYPERLAHVWGDNFEKDGSDRDLTFLPRASHDSITYGSAGVFMTAEDLARWTHALFNGKVISRESLNQMCAFAGPEAYGLGVGRLGHEVAGRVRAFGHGGGNIGTSAWMAYLPDYEVSVAVMINRYGGNGAALIVRDVSAVTTRFLKPPPISEVLLSPKGLFTTMWLVAGAGAVVVAIRKHRAVLLVVFAIVAFASGWVSKRGSLPLDDVLFPEAGAIGLIAFGLLVRRWKSRSRQA